ncbi:NfeD family protein [candidate division GN15 bacterium]|jgi:membrane protein implicated in regulation of membrane protease activity|nr:NfeD family protein [candidate division GN15 bacterium]
MPTMFWIWLAIAAVFLIIELATPTLLFVSFFAGAVVAALYALGSPEGYYWQMGLFLIVSVVLLPVMRKLAKRITREPGQSTNVDRMIGQEALVVKAIDPENGGQVRFEGEIWVATADEAIPEHTRVMITSVSGVKVRVTRKE